MAKITTRKQRDRIVNKLQNKEAVWLLTPRTTTRWGGKIGEDIYNPGYTSRNRAIQIQQRLNITDIVDTT